MLPPRVIPHDVETSLLARSNSSQSDPLPGSCFTHGDLLSDGCNEPINGESIFRIAPVNTRNTRYFRGS